MSITSEELKNIMSDCYGTESYTRYGIVNKILLTDGVVMFAEKAGCFWFLDELTISLLPKALKRAEDETLFAIRLEVKDEKAKIIITDGDENILVEKKITYTDCPTGIWDFCYDSNSNVMLYYLEY